MTPSPLFVDNLKLKNKKAFSDLYDQYAPLLYGEIKATLKQDQHAAGTLSGTFRQISKSIHEYDASKEKLFTWLLKIARKQVQVKKIDMVLYELFRCRKGAENT